MNYSTSDKYSKKNLKTRKCYALSVSVRVYLVFSCVFDYIRFFIMRSLEKYKI